MVYHFLEVSWVFLVKILGLQMLIKHKLGKCQQGQNITLALSDFGTLEILDFLCHLYKSTRYEEMAGCGWSELQIDTFLTQQFQFQHRDYTARYKKGLFYLIHYREKRCGRIYLNHGKSEIRVVDIALLPEFRGRGIGSSLFTALIAEAKELGIPVTLHVEVFNQCQRLYQRLGFIAESSNGVHTFMKLEP